MKRPMIYTLGFITCFILSCVKRKVYTFSDFMSSANFIYMVKFLIFYVFLISFVIVIRTQIKKRVSRQ